MGNGFQFQRTHFPLHFIQNFSPGYGFSQYEVLQLSIILEETVSRLGASLLCLVLAVVLIVLPELFSRESFLISLPTCDFTCTDSRDSLFWL